MFRRKDGKNCTFSASSRTGMRAILLLVSLIGNVSIYKHRFTCLTDSLYLNCWVLFIYNRILKTISELSCSWWKLTFEATNKYPLQLINAIFTICKKYWKFIFSQVNKNFSSWFDGNGKSKMFHKVFVFPEWRGDNLVAVNSNNIVITSLIFFLCISKTFGTPLPLSVGMKLEGKTTASRTCWVEKVFL